MAQPRSLVFSGVDPGLARAIAATASTYQPYEVIPFSGRESRGGKPSFHPGGKAVDIKLINRANQQEIPDIGDPASAPIYQAYANYLYNWALQNDPALASKLRWGGYFQGGRVPRDYMHFDIGGGPGGMQMLGGSWQGGFDPAFVQQVGLKQAGGIGGAQPVQTASAGGTVDVLGNPRGSGSATDQPLALNAHIPAKAGPIETFIRQAAVKHGIDPDQAMRVFMAEGGPDALSDPYKQSDIITNGVREPSFGPLQLNVSRGVGAEAIKAGFDPRKDWQGAADFALQWAAQHGWGD